VRYDELLGFWKWMYRVNPFTYVVEGTMTNEMHGLTIEVRLPSARLSLPPPRSSRPSSALTRSVTRPQCTPRELRVFNPPAEQTCAEWAGAFIDASTGYLTNPTATSACECA